MFHFRLALFPYAHIGRFFLLALLLLSASRCALVSYFSPRLDWSLLPGLLLQGLRFDLIALAYLSMPALLLSLFTPASSWHRVDGLIRHYYRILLLLLLAMEAVGFGFLLEYEHRPDALFWEYLSYPHEVLPMLWGGFKAEIALTLGLIVLAAWLGRQVFATQVDSAPSPGPGLRLMAGIPCLLLLALLARSSLGHRPANISSALFSDNRLANELALNSSYTAAYALYSRKNDASVRLVPPMDLAQAAAVVSASLPGSEWPLGQSVTPTLHTVRPHVPRERPLNVVILLEESLGARFVGALGGQDLTPRLDALADKGLWLTRLYATGTRTVRGIEAVLCGFPPSPARSVVKRNRSRRNFFTLAQALKPRGYQNIFVYGGEPNFDDMGSFMLGNGFDRLVAGEASFPAAVYRGSWGVSDEDWARQAHAQFERANAQGPFFGFMLSTSNHTPWEFPAGRIDPGSGPLASRENAIRYADYAIGLFFDLALNSSYADNTVFLVVADHDARVAGNDFVPVDRFHIPGLIIAPGLEPRHYEEVASQIDLITTIMPMLGVELESPAPGRDLLSPEPQGPGRALMQYGNNAGLLMGDQLVINTPTGEPLFRRNRNGQLEPAPAAPELYQLSRAYLNLAEQLYAQEAYRPGGLVR